MPNEAFGDAEAFGGRVDVLMREARRDGPPVAIADGDVHAADDFCLSEPNVPKVAGFVIQRQGTSPQLSNDG
jgi:hypothetical protein